MRMFETLPSITNVYEEVGKTYSYFKTLYILEYSEFICFVNK